MGKVTWKGSALLAPAPAVLVTCGTVEKPNVLTVAWTGIACTRPPVTYISLRPERFSYPLIRQAGEFVINLTTRELVRAVDFCGVRSGKEFDKFALCGLTAQPCEKVAAPMLAESPLSLECKVAQVIPLGSHDLFLAEIVAVHAEESLLDAGGKLHLDKSGLLAYAHGAYYGLGPCLGTFGFSVRKPAKGRRSAGNSRPKKRER